MEVIILLDINYPNHIELMSYNAAIANIRVLNINEIGNGVWLKLPAGISTNLTFLDFSEITMDTESIDYEGHITQDTHRIWFVVDTDILNITAGFHMYRVTFNNTNLNVDFCLYFGYQIQTNTPERPYIYMKDH